MTIKDFLDITHFYRHSKIRLNKKRIKAKKLKNILLNNYSQETEIRIETKLQVQPFYKGDYRYFANKHYMNGFSRLQCERMYITIL